MRVLVLDTDESFREALVARLATAGHTARAVVEPDALRTLVDALEPRVVVAPADLAGRRLLPDVRRAFDGPLAVIVDPADPDAIREAGRFGARGCLLRADPLDQHVEGLRTIADGGFHASPTLASTLLSVLSRRSTGSAHTTLTAREIEVLDQASRGHSNREIAEALGIAENTVKNHLRNILEKLHLHSRLEAVLHAVREGLVSLE